MFFYRVDSVDLALGLDTSQWISLVLVGVAVAGLVMASRPQSMSRMRRLISPLAILMVLLAVGVAGCNGGDSPVEPVVEDPGPIHVHGLGSNPTDGALFIATHTGLFRLEVGERKAQRVGDRFQDTMAFTVVGRDHFLGSGHPDARDDLPPYLGLIQSRDAGRRWREASLQGKADFHLLEVAGRRVYGYGSDFETRAEQFLVSMDRGETWQRLKPPAPLISLAVDPADSSHAVASSAKGLYSSSDGGRSWRRLEGDSGLLSWPDSRRLYLTKENGTVQTSSDGGGRWRAVGQAGGTPAAFEAASKNTLFLALHDGTIEGSTDGGKTWTVRSKP